MLASFIALVCACLGLLHFYWASGGRAGWVAAIPEVNGRPAFTPGAPVTFTVALGFFTCATLVAAAGGLVRLPVPSALLRKFTFGLALVFLLRAIGDFRLLGFFKRVHGSRFARLDTDLYSPLCLALAAGVFLVAFRRRT